MIERNLGNIERVARFLMGVCFALWAVSQPYMNGIEWFVVAVSLMLILNGIFSRCYLWFIFDISTSNTGTGSCNSAQSC